MEENIIDKIKNLLDKKIKEEQELSKNNSDKTDKNIFKLLEDEDLSFIEYLDKFPITFI